MPAGQIIMITEMHGGRGDGLLHGGQEAETTEGTAEWEAAFRHMHPVTCLLQQDPSP